MHFRTFACLLAALGAGGLTACGADNQASGPESFDRSDAPTLVLTPGDVGRGYSIGDDSGCGRFSPEGQDERFTDFVHEARAAGCTNEIAYIWGRGRTVDVPRRVESAIAVFDDDADARKAMDMREELIRFMVGEVPKDFDELPDFGHDALRFSNTGYDVPVGAGVVWRNANSVAVVFAGGPGMTPGEASKSAVELAHKQQDRIEHPRKPAPDEGEDVELPLDDPGLDLPVYWLGRTFEPGDDLPPLELATAYAGESPGELGYAVEMDYGVNGPRSGVKVWVFSPAAFERFEKGILGRLVTGSPCAERTEVKVPGGGRAVVWAIFAKPVQAPCPTRPYDRYVAYVHFAKAVVAINQPWCLYPCSAPEEAAPYNTSQGVLAIAHELRIREPRPG